MGNPTQGSTGNDQLRYETEVGSYLIASLLLGHDPITTKGHHAAVLENTIRGTVWRTLYDGLREVPKPSRREKLDRILEPMENRCQLAQQIVHAGTVILAPSDPDRVQDNRGQDDSVRTFKQIEPMFDNLSWVWPKWIPVGYLTMIAGDPGIGKSAAMLKLVQAALRQTAWPDGVTVDTKFFGRPVVWLDTEGTQAITIERCRAWGVDSALLLYPKDPTRPEEPFPIFRLHEKHWIEILRNVIQKHRPFVVVVDSLRGSFTGDENSSELQQILQSLAELARDTVTAIVLIHHLRKRSADENSGEVTIDRVRGSTAIAAMMRSIIALDKPDPSVEAVRFKVIKSNLCRAPEALGLQVGEQVEFCTAPEEPRRETTLRAAIEFLRGRLQTGPRPAADLYEDAEGAGLSRSALKKAKGALGVVARREGGIAGSGRWVWALQAWEKHIGHEE